MIIAKYEVLGKRRLKMYDASLSRALACKLMKRDVDGSGRAQDTHIAGDARQA